MKENKIEIVKRDKEVWSCVNYFENVCIKEFSQVIPREKIWISGGAIRDFFLKKQITDIDLYFKDDNSLYKLIDYCKKHCFNKMIESENSIKMEFYGVKFDFVKKTYNSIEDTLLSYDFQQNMIGLYDGQIYKEQNIRLHYDIKQENLKFGVKALKEQKIEKLIVRIVKMCNKGYFLQREELDLLIEEINLRFLEDKNFKIGSSSSVDY